MKILRALFYHYYWKQIRESGDDVFLIPITFFRILCPFFGIITFVVIVFLVTDLIPIRNFSSTMIYTSLFIIGLAILWWIFLRKKRYKAIIQEHDIYNTRMYRTIANLYPIICVIFFFIAAYIGYRHNSQLYNT